MNDLPPPDPLDNAFEGEDLTAAEYALGVLDPEARAAAEARAEQDPQFGGEILAWVVRLAPLIEAVRGVDPSPLLWMRIEAAIDRSAGAARSTTPPPSLPIPAHKAPRDPMLWRAWAVGASAVAVAALLFIVLRPAAPGDGQGQAPSILASASAPAGHILVARLALTSGGASALTVAYNPSRAMLYAAPDADFSIPQSRSAELWLIPADGKPRPMGVIDANKPATLPMPEKFASLARDKATLALSIEPVGGSTTDLPTGPVVAAGKFTPL